MTVERVQGPTPAGGAYAILIRDECGRIVEVVEYTASGRELLRTYGAAWAADGSPRPAQ